MRQPTARYPRSRTVAATTRVPILVGGAGGSGSWTLSSDASSKTPARSPAPSSSSSQPSHFACAEAKRRSPRQRSRRHRLSVREVPERCAHHRRRRRPACDRVDCYLTPHEVVRPSHRATSRPAGLRLARGSSGSARQTRRQLRRESKEALPSRRAVGPGLPIALSRFPHQRSPSVLAPPTCAWPGARSFSRRCLPARPSCSA